MNVFAKSLAVIAALMVGGLAHAYIGPGAGLSAIGSILALLGAVLLMIVGFVWYPLKRLRNRRSNKASPSKDVSPSSLEKSHVDPDPQKDRSQS